MKITDLAGEQNLKPRISKSMVYGFSQKQIQTTRKFSPKSPQLSPAGLSPAPDYAPLRESRQQVFIKRRLLELKLSVH